MHASRPTDTGCARQALRSPDDLGNPMTELTVSAGQIDMGVGGGIVDQYSTPRSPVTATKSSSLSGRPVYRDKVCGEVINCWGVVELRL